MSQRYNGKEEKKDLHESNKDYLNTCRTMAYKAANYFNSIGDNWEMINCLGSDGNSIRTIDDIADEVYGIVLKFWSRFTSLNKGTTDITKIYIL